MKLRNILIPLGLSACSLSLPSQTTIIPLKNNSFHLTAQVNGIPVNFLVDTGAMFVVLPSELAAKFNVNPSLSNFDKLIVQTADGTNFKSTEFHLANLQIGSCLITNVQSVILDKLREPLLGIEALKKMNVEITHDAMTLSCSEKPMRPNEISAQAAKPVLATNSQ